MRRERRNDARPRAAALEIKRYLDVVLSLILLTLSLPLVATTALLMTITSPGGVFFRQERVGRGGRPFMMYKFRTMRTGRSADRARGLPLSDVRGPVFKLRSDPRVTPLGRLLRVSSLDELPQLWNVLRGDMSLVGPRPALPS